MRSVDIAILGAGISGLSLGYFLPRAREYAVFEAEPYVGGLIATYRKGDFLFDKGGHYLHYKQDSSAALFQRLCGPLSVHSYVRESGVFHQGRIIPYPFQYNYRFFQRSALKVPRISRSPKRGQPAHFLAWMERSFDQYALDAFMTPYNKKFWRRDLEDLDYSWAEQLIPRKRGGLSRVSTLVGYNKRLHYPCGGIGKIAERLGTQLDERVMLRKKAMRVDLSAKQIYFADGSIVRYHRLVSTIPLPEFLRFAGYAAHAQNHLESTRTVIFNAAAKLGGIAPWHWVYYPQSDIIFYRIGRYTPFLPPSRKDCQTIYVEMSIDARSPLKCCVRDMLKSMRHLNIIASDASIVEDDLLDIPYAYPIPYLKTQKTVAGIQKELSRDGVFLSGRFGLWRYWSIEDCVVHASALARQLSGSRGQRENLKHT